MKAPVITIGALVIWALPLYAANSFAPDKPNRIAFATTEARFVRQAVKIDPLQHEKDAVAEYGDSWVEGPDKWRRKKRLRRWP